MTQKKISQTNITQSKEEKPKLSEILLQLIDASGFEFFHDDHGDAFCKYPSQKSNVYEVTRINNRNFKNYLSFIYRRSEGKTISDQSLKEAISELEGRALHDKKSRKEKVFLRCGEANGKIYIDLCNDKWQAVEVSSTGWKVLDSKNLPVLFERSQHALSLPDPNSSDKGDISKLWEIVNIPKEDQVLTLAFMLECYRCTTAFPLLILLGLQDSGKSATQNTIRSLIDPSSSNLRTAPRKVDDLVVDAASNWLVSYNNVSSLSDEMHDDFCCIATGSGFATRKLFKNLQQIVVNICRPVVINGIYNFIRRPDLLDRAIILELDSIDESMRKTDSQLEKMVREHLPSIFRGLLDLLVRTLKILPSVTLDRQPRMADFALLGIAIEKASALPDGTFITRYRTNRADAKDNILESSPVMLALVDYMKNKPIGYLWRGRSTDLLDHLTKEVKPTPHTTWPKNPNSMSGELKRYTPSLQLIGINVVSESKLTGKKNREGNYYQISKVALDKKEIDKKAPQIPQAPRNDVELNNHATSRGIDFVERAGLSDGVHSTGSAKAPHLTKPANPHGIYIPTESVEPVVPVELKNEISDYITPVNDSILIQ